MIQECKSDTYQLYEPTNWDLSALALYGLLGPGAAVNKVVGKEGILGNNKVNCKLQILVNLLKIGLGWVRLC